MMVNNKVFSVREVNQYAKNLILNDAILNEINISGEVVGYRPHHSGHLYFTLKDENNSINCVMFKTYADYLPFKVQNGAKVVVTGSVTIYEVTGSYQVAVKAMKPFGMGDLQLKIEKLKEELYSLGYFDNANKKALPTYPKNVCIITSKTGAVLQDILNISNRRNKGINVYVYHTQVQGETAKYDIAQAINEVNKLDYIDTIILARGGGSFIDLLPFNEEEVATAIFKSRIPIVSAIGHETDYTIADLVADFRASTPSEAAEICFVQTDDLIAELIFLKDMLDTNLNRKLNLEVEKIDRIKNHKFFIDPLYIKNKYNDELMNDYNKLNNVIDKKLNDNKLILSHLTRLTNSLNPLNILEKGFSVTEKDDGSIIKNIKDVKVSDTIITKVNDGFIKSSVIDKGKIK